MKSGRILSTWRWREWERRGRGVILPPKHELGSWQPPMVEMELLRKRWRFMMR